MIFRFGAFELDEDRFELRRESRRVEVQPKVLELLLLLVRADGRLVPKREVLQAVWPCTAVTDGSLARVVSLARAAIGDRGAEPALIVTVPRRGYRFEGPVSTRPAAPAAGAPSPRLDAEDPGARYIGRATLLARLEAQLDSALAGSGRILFLAGEAGIGKTRTAELLARRAERSGARIAAAWGLDRSAEAHASWAALLRALVPRAADALGALRPEQRTALARLLPELAEPHAAPDSARREEVERFAVFDAVQELLLGAAREAPLALVLDDLHAADADSIVLLELLGRSITTARIAVVVTCREEDAARTPRSARAIERLLRVTTLERWPLGGLDASDTSEFVRARLGGPADAALLEALARQTGGNPLLMGESLRSLEARDLLDTARDVPGWEALLPRGIHHLLLPKLEGVSAEARELLAAAVAIGGEIEPRVLERCVPAATRVSDRVEELRGAGLLVPGAAGRGARFAHGLVREALYEELLPEGERRREVHARVSRALEAAACEGDDHSAVRAHHALEAGPLVPAGEAARLARRAARQAMTRFDFEGAARWCERALARLAAPTDGEPLLRIELLLSLGAAQARAFGLDRARPSYREAADRARRLGRGDLLSEAALGFAHRPTSTGSADAEAIELLEEALRGAAELPGARRVQLLSRLAVELRYRDLERSDRLTEEAVLAARALSDPVVLAQALDDSSFVRWSPRDPEGWIALNAEIEQVAESCGDLELVFAGQRGLATGHLELGDRSAVEREASRARRSAEALRIPFGRWYCAAHRALLGLLDGDLAAAEGPIVDAIAESERVGTSELALEAVGQLVYLRYEQGRGGELLASVRAQVERFSGMAVWRAALLRLLASAGFVGEARRELAQLARKRFAEVPRDRGYLLTLAMAAEVAHALGDAAAAEALEPLLAPYARLHVVGGSGTLYYGAVAHALALTQTTRARWSAAITGFERALAAEEKLGARLWAARTKLECARALLARGEAGDLARAVGLVREGMDAARRWDWAEVSTTGAGLESALGSVRGRGAVSPLIRRASER